jgi:hypothetical protein
MPSIIYRVAILSCRGCIAVLAEIATASRPDVSDAIYRTIHALNSAITIMETA